MTLLERVRHYIAENPEELDQGKWCRHTDCGTTRCVGGTAVYLNGDTFIFGRLYMDTTCMDLEGVVWNIGARAQRLLGLDDYDASKLFYHTRNENVLAALDQLIAQQSKDGEG